MIAADTSSMIAFLVGDTGDDAELVQSALDQQQLALPPIVLTELLSDPGLPRQVRELLAALPILDVEPGFWERAGLLRASVLKPGRRRASPTPSSRRVASINRPPLVTRDRDFRHFAKAAGLSLSNPRRGCLSLTQRVDRLSGRPSALQS